MIVPGGVLFGSRKARKELRRLLVEEQKLDAAVSLPGGGRYTAMLRKYITY